MPALCRDRARAVRRESRPLSELTRQITPRTWNGHAPLPVASREEPRLSVLPTFDPGKFPRVVIYDTVCHNNLLSKINISQLPPATARWLSCYLRRRQAKTCFRGDKSTSRKVNTGVPQGSKLSPSLFSVYIADMPIPTEPVKRVCYADDITVWATGVKIPDLEDSVNSYLEEIIAYLKDNSLLISAPKSRCSAQIHTKPRPSREYSLRTHSYRSVNTQRC